MCIYGKRLTLSSLNLIISSSFSSLSASGLLGGSVFASCFLVQPNTFICFFILLRHWSLILSGRSDFPIQLEQHTNASFDATCCFSFNNACPLRLYSCKNKMEFFKIFIKASSFPKEYSAPSTTCQEIKSKLCYRPSLNNDHLSTTAGLNPA